MKVDLKIGGIAGSSLRARARALIRDAVAMREAENRGSQLRARTQDEMQRNQTERGN